MKCSDLDDKFQQLRAIINTLGETVEDDQARMKLNAIAEIVDDLYSVYMCQNYIDEHATRDALLLVGHLLVLAYEVIVMKG